MTTSSPTISRSDLTASLHLVQVKPGVQFSLALLKKLLPDAETLLFFGKVYELDAAQLSHLMQVVLDSDLVSELLAGDHSLDLQDYIVDLELFDPRLTEGEINYAPDVPHGEILPHVWADLELEVADSIKAVASKLESVLDALPGKEGQMLFKSMRVLNAKRPTLGDYRAHINHPPVAENLVILDCSGSMSEHTIRTIVDDVVALSYKANAHMAVVSNTCTYWEPGSYGVDEVLAAAEYGGTYYEELVPLFDRDWGTVVTIADFDSSYSAKQALSAVSGRIDQVLDISLVNRPTFLSECVGQLATEVRPLLIGSSYYVL